MAPIAEDTRRLKSESISYTLWIKSGLFVLIVHGSLLGVIPWLLGRIGRSPFDWPITPLERAVGACMILFSLPVYTLSFLQLVAKGNGTPAIWAGPRYFLDKGIYRFSRNPMYFAMVVLVMAQALLAGSGWLLAYAVILWAGIYFIIVWIEEPRLYRQFGYKYEAYRQYVRRWI